MSGYVLWNVLQDQFPKDAVSLSAILATSGNAVEDQFPKDAVSLVAIHAASVVMQRMAKSLPMPCLPTG